jgi:hypothetical protein
VVCEHSVCYAAFIIPEAEGRNEAYSFLTTHFDQPPQFVVYDFSCSLMEYYLNRAPQFFRHTVFLVDRFHWKGHKACSWGFCMTLTSLFF